MGLDMWLKAKVYVGGRHSNIESGYIEFEHRYSKEGKIRLPTQNLMYVEYDIGYWRKANQIHKWFVDNVQGGEDNCKQYEVSKEQLLELKKICLDILHNKDDKEGALEVLPPCAGFFFGATNTESEEFWQYYFEDLENTVKILDTALQYIELYNADIYYDSSW